MPTTFRTDPDTGRTVISSENIVRGDGMTDRERGMTMGQRVDNRISDGGATVDGRDTVRRGYESMNAPTLPGTGYMSRSEFEAVSGMTATNPYGKSGFFTRMLGIDPSRIDYSSTLGPQGIEGVKRVAYDRFVNPYARVNVFGDPTVGADPQQGVTRKSVRPGDITVFGPAVAGRAEGIAGMLQSMPGVLGMLGRASAPTRIPGYDTGTLLPDLGLGGPQPGEGVDPAQRLEQDLYGYESMPDLSAQTSIPTTSELTDERIRMAREELARGTAGFPEQYEVAPAASSIPTAEEMVRPSTTPVPGIEELGVGPFAPTPGATSELLGDAYYQQARRELEEDQRRRGDRIDFMLDLLEAAPKAFEPRFTAPSVPASPPPVFGEQVDLANPATFGLTGFRP